MRVHLACLVLTACDATAPAPASAPALPATAVAALTDTDRTIPYSGYVDFDGQPVNANSVDFAFSLYPCASTTSCQPLWSDSVTLPIFAGRFTVELGGAGQDPLPDVIFEAGHEVLYLAIQIEGKALGNLQKIAPATHAISANETDHLRVRSAVDFDAGAAINGSPLFDGDLEVTGTLMVNGAFGRLGRSANNPGGTCAQIHAADAGAASGLYWIAPGGGAAFQVQCDMTSGLTFAAFERGAKRPIAWWDMETMRGADVRDLIGSNDLVVMGAPTAGVAGQNGKAYEFKNSIDFLQSKSAFASQLLGGSPKSISVWFRSDTLAGGLQALFGFGASGTDAVFAVVIYPTGNYSFIAGNNDHDSGVPVALGRWHHFVGTFDGKVIRQYVDGQLVMTTVRTVNTLAQRDRYNVGIGSWDTGTTTTMRSGAIDEPRVYDYALDAREVLALFDLGVRLGEE